MNKVESLAGCNEQYDLEKLSASFVQILKNIYYGTFLKKLVKFFK